MNSTNFFFFSPPFNSFNRPLFSSRFALSKMTRANEFENFLFSLLPFQFFVSIEDTRSKMNSTNFSSFFFTDNSFNYLSFSFLSVCPFHRRYTSKWIRQISSSLSPISPNCIHLSPSSIFLSRFDISFLPLSRGCTQANEFVRPGNNFSSRDRAIPW